jgi:hypothetical protein
MPTQPETLYLKQTASTSLAEESGLRLGGSLLGSYQVSDGEMAVGSTFGGPRLFCVLRATGAIDKVYSVDAGATLLGNFVMQHWDGVSGVRLQRLPGSFGIHPEYQDHRFLLSNGVDVSESIFALNTASRGADIDAGIVYALVNYRNTLDHVVEMDTYAFCEIAGETAADVEARYERSLKGLLAWNRERSEHARFLGCSMTPESWETTFDRGKTVGERAPGRLLNDVSAKGRPLGALRLRHRIEPHQSVEFAFLLGVGADGIDQLARQIRAAPEPHDALAGTRDHFHAALLQSIVLTPNADVNLGVTWAKANMLRVQLKPKTGWSFTNDPSRSSKAVGRDTAFFAQGSDYMTPEFSRDSLMAFVERQRPSGMMIEWYDMVTGETADYGLNVNDNTPLLILALWHHAVMSGDRAFLEHVYPHAKRAGEYILSQRNESGLVWCTSRETGSRGIAGWRNVIENYRISGASTELNSECYGALRVLTKMADVLGKKSDSTRFEREAENLRAAVNRHLTNPDNGLYLLTIDADGTRRTELSCDLVFPVLYEVADAETAERIVRRLSADDFWTEAGIRTIPHDAPDYSPDRGSGLLGGVWVGVSFWYGFCASRFLPSKMEEALATTFENYSRDPRRSNTVPGQFSEWLHGETLVNQGMMLSPWFSPRYVWAAVEGALGFSPDFDGASLFPRFPSSWRWMGARNVPFQGRSLTWFVVRDTTGSVHGFANAAFKDGIPVVELTEDVSSLVDVSGDDVSVVALRDRRRTLVFIGSSSPSSFTTRLRAPQLRARTLRAYDSLRECWMERGIVERDTLANGYLVNLAPHDYTIFEFLHQS